MSSQRKSGSTKARGRERIFNEGTAAETTRTTIVLPIALDENLAIYAMQERLTKNEIIKTAMSEYLKNKGLQPDRRPKLEVSYKS
ncbi:MAG TPA: hypothetical protein VF544_15735 [Pyrinomonadaceae bacterium]|jgi:hypothetical protein